MNNMFKNFTFGPIRGINFSHLGIALKNSMGEMVSYDKEKDEIVNVDLLNFSGDNLAYQMPVAIKDVKVGDVIKHTSGDLVFVTSIKENGGLVVVDVAKGEEKSILPTKSMFGFDFVTKVVSLIDFTNISASEDSPFGNLLPLMLMGGGDNNAKNMMLPLMMMNGGSLEDMFDTSNPMMLMALMGSFGGSESNNFFPLMMMMSKKKQ